MANNPGRQTPLAKYQQEDWEEAREAYLLEHTPGLKEHDAAQHRAFLQIEEDALARHPDPTPNDFAAAEAVALSGVTAETRTPRTLKRVDEIPGAGASARAERIEAATRAPIVRSPATIIRAPR